MFRQPVEWVRERMWRRQNAQFQVCAPLIAAMLLSIQFQWNLISFTQLLSAQPLCELKVEEKKRAKRRRRKMWLSRERCTKYKIGHCWDHNTAFHYYSVCHGSTGWLPHISFTCLLVRAKDWHFVCVCVLALAGKTAIKIYLSKQMCLMALLLPHKSNISVI